jgi:hypothetical protein
MAGSPGQASRLVRAALGVAAVGTTFRVVASVIALVVGDLVDGTGPLRMLDRTVIEPTFAHPLWFPDGRVLVIRFPTFTPRITFHADGRLTIEIIEGENAGFRDTIPYQAALLRANLVVLSWQEQIGGTVVHVLDLDVGRTYSVVGRARGTLLRLAGTIEQGR